MDTSNNEFDCPLLMLTNLLYCINSHKIQNPVSIIHECTDSCKFITTTISSTVEHEHLHTSGPSYYHDTSNKMYCLNVYCSNH